MRPDMEGAAAEVPPTTKAASSVAWPCEKVAWQLPSTHIKYPSWEPAAVKAISGMSRAPSFGTPLPDCQEGFEYPLWQKISSFCTVDCVQLLEPPPPATIKYSLVPPHWVGSVVGSQDSFQTASGI